MPSSTTWRGRGSGSLTRGISPLRPSIESLSPGPHHSSPTFDYNSFQNSVDQSHSRLPQGLGLFGTSLTSENFGVVQPDHIYIDQNGGAHVGARVRTTNYPARESAKGGRNTQNKNSSRTSRTNKAKGHTRSGSTIDDLANAAIATSPTFAQSSPSYAFGSPSSFNYSRPATSYINGYNNDENLYDRPSKRIKSEKLHAAEWSPRDDRPRTSHNYKYQSRTEDAELLLSLSYGVSWTQASPVPATSSLFQQPPEPSIESSKNVEVLVDEVIQPVSEAIVTAEDEIPKEIVPEEIKDTKTAEEILIVKEADQQQEDIQDSKPTEATPKSSEPATTDEPTSDQASAQQTPAEQLQDGRLDMPTEIEMTAGPAPKRTKRLQPEVQAEVCATCQRLQRDGNEEDSTTHWIGCENCKKWHHAACAGFQDKQEARSVDKFFCKDCEPTCGPTTFVRKSTRARTAIDYAGLNQGVVKPSDDSSMHHYIQPIKDGRIKVHPDDFARIRPEILTAEFWENMDGMKRPFVVPACWNPRFGQPKDALEAITSEKDSVPPKDIPLGQQNNEENEIVNEPGNTEQYNENQQSESCQEEVVDCDQDYLDMVMPQNLTVRRVAELYGPHEPVPVIDVKSQETKGSFTLSDWAQYYELDGDKPIRNVISLEVSNSRLGRLIRRPRVVRDIDLEDHVWDHDSRATGKKRPVQFYCLMSVADSYTDFHIDFGGSSVYYHILKGVKTFFFIPPEDRYLKKYEEWCNSDSQNETWLPDLCGGNVTRVDLHEGDTAFIPAGWIHSVWTPEDSLVIGGNFLTRVDYELQLKVFNVEKTTNVPLKFRYPFFQKVMWYSLLKYLEEDPVPEDVLREFHEDPEHRFLRANPIWYELDDFANLAEPGDAEFNARVYPKSELKGLPALRDYLYRTARIYADLPVPDINKKQIESVKASILKGYGDPMQLIKMFAVWCAWKIGNETVPEWVHHDAGLLLEIKKAEELKKQETFRVPPERVSARKASQARSTPTVEDLDITPHKGIQSTTSEDADRKQRSGSKSSNSRLACEPCRKRRIKCRHKDGDISPSNTSPAAIRPRTYSNVSVEIPKLTCASPVMNGYEQASTANGSTPDFSNTSDLAQAALASLNSQSSDPGQLPPLSLGPSSSKKGRSKACEECRKSKRRCVHDEYGRVDPAKAAEPSKPRGSATKRAAGSSGDFSVKKVKLETEFDTSLMDPALLELAQPLIFDSINDPSQMTEFENMTNGYDYAFMTHGPEVEMDDVYGTNLISASQANGDGEADIHRHQLPSAEMSNDSTGVDDANVDPNLPPAPLVTAQVAYLRQSPEHDISYSPITVDGHTVESTEIPDVVMENVEPSPARSRHSSGQPAQVSDQLGKVGPDVDEMTVDPAPRVARSEGRETSTNSEHTTEITPHSRRTSTNTSATTHQAVAMKHKMSIELSGRPVSRGSTVSSDLDADERMARELQAAENGLRRRTSVRA